MPEPALGLVTVTRRPAVRPAERLRPERRARRPAWWGSARHAPAMPLLAREKAGVGRAIGLDSLIEVVAGTVRADGCC